jgi:hypothetical protein
MKNALISPNWSPINYVSSWEIDPNFEDAYIAIYSPLSNSQGVSQVSNETFEVAEPLFWIECDDIVTVEAWYYNTVNKDLELIPNVPYPLP